MVTTKIRLLLPMLRPPSIMLSGSATVRWSKH
nr:MAG TPA: hypothetical protein [Caudoviricetes sp.]DAM11625.1 MAG TPA: hypothetical protein [Caudoviricetes sp.]